MKAGIDSSTDLAVDRRIPAFAGMTLLECLFIDIVRESAMIDALMALLFCQLAGEVGVRGLGLPLPGPVAGMILLFLLLAWRGRATGAKDPPPALIATADALLGNLSLLFVPAAVGVIRYGSLLRSHGVVMLTAVVASTVLALGVTALVFEATRRFLERRG